MSTHLQLDQIESRHCRFSYLKLMSIYKWLLNTRFREVSITSWLTSYLTGFGFDQTSKSVVHST